MTLYPNAIDNNTSLPPYYAADNTYSYKFIANTIPPSDFTKMLKADTSQGLTLDLNKSYLVRINCMIFLTTDKSTTANYSQFIVDLNVYCDGSGNVTASGNYSYSNNPTGYFNLNVTTGTQEILLLANNANLTDEAAAVAMVEYVSI